MKIRSEKIAESGTFDLSEVIEINPKFRPSVKITARGNVGLSFTDGNTDIKSAYLDAGFVARTHENRITIGGEYNREETEGVTSADRVLDNLKYDHFLSTKWYGYGKTGL